MNSKDWLSVTFYKIKKDNRLGQMCQALRPKKIEGSLQKVNLFMEATLRDLPMMVIHTVKFHSLLLLKKPMLSKLKGRILKSLKKSLNRKSLWRRRRSLKSSNLHMTSQCSLL